jgi:AcrR family transcriptional regulator
MAATMPELSGRQREILDTARALLARDGVEALSLGSVAKAIGIKTPSLYKHFGSRADLEAALIATGLQELAEALEAAGEDLHSLGAAYRSFALAHPELYRLMTAGPLPREKLPEGLEARAALPMQKALPDPHLARAAAALAHGLASLEIAQRFPPWSKLEKSWERALDALAAAKPPGLS